MPPIKVSNAEYWQIYWAVGRPVRAARVRRAVRLGRDDVPGLYARAWENVRDAAPWGVLADALHEGGAEAWAGFLRRLAGAAPGMDDYTARGTKWFLQHESATHGGYPETMGHVHGLPALIYTLTTPPPVGGYGIYLWHPEVYGRGSRQGVWGAVAPRHLWASVDPPTGRQLIHELTGPMFPNDQFDDEHAHPDRLKQLVGEPERLARGGWPVRMATPHEIQQLLANLRDRPDDRGLRGVLADAMDEAGRGHEAASLRSADPVYVWLTHGGNPELRLRRGDARTGAWMDADTPEGARTALFHALTSHINIHIGRGDPATGRDTLDEHSNHGHLYVPNPWYGEAPLPAGRGNLMIQYGRSPYSYMPVYGGRIVRVRWYAPGQPAHGRVLWQHPTYHHGKIEIVPNPEGRAIVAPDGDSQIAARRNAPRWHVSVDGEPHTGFNTALAARRWVAKMGLDLG